MAYRLALPRGHRVRRMWHVQADMTDLMITEIEQNDFVFLLYQLHAELNAQCEWRRLRPALVMGIGKDSPAQFHFANLPDGRCRLWPQDRIGVITDHTLDDAAVGPAKLADNRTRSGRWRFKVEPARPYA